MPEGAHWRQGRREKLDNSSSVGELYRAVIASIHEYVLAGSAGVKGRALWIKKVHPGALILSCNSTITGLVRKHLAELYRELVGCLGDRSHLLGEPVLACIQVDEDIIRSPEPPNEVIMRAMFMNQDGEILRAVSQGFPGLYDNPPCSIGVGCSGCPYRPTCRNRLI